MVPPLGGQSAHPGRQPAAAVAGDRPRPAARAQLRGLSLERLAAAAQLHLNGRVDSTLAASRLALRSVAVRYRQLTTEITTLDRLVTQAAPALMALPRVGTDTAAALLVAAGDNPERLRSEAAFAHLCGVVAPIPASSGKTTQHRLHRGGNRDANRALWVIAMGRLRWDLRTRVYMARRTAEGKSKLEVIRCLKRFIAREVYRVLRDPADPAGASQQHPAST